MINISSWLRYPHLNDLVISASRGSRQDVAHFDRNINLILQIFYCKGSGRNMTLFLKSMTFRFSKCVFFFLLTIHFKIHSHPRFLTCKVMYTVWLCPILKDLKATWTFSLPNDDRFWNFWAICSDKRYHLVLIYYHLATFSFLEIPFFGNFLGKMPVSSIFCKSFNSYPAASSIKRSIFD